MNEAVLRVAYKMLHAAMFLEAKMQTKTVEVMQDIKPFVMRYSTK